MAEAKQELQLADSPGFATPISEQVWTNHEETQARRKIDGSVLPLLYLGLLVFQLDRMNLASALTGGFAKDIGVNQDTINLGNQLMFLGIVILEIPSNMLLQKVGPRKNLGFNRIQANALAAVGASLALVVVFIVAWISDKTNKRGLSVIGERSISIAMWVMLSISGLMVGTQYYRGNDTPFYQTGLRTQIIMVSIGMGFAILQVIIYTLHNKRVAEGKYKPAKGEVPRIYVP
ncbi:putative transporter [Colletotrichum sp. SAR 10_65]|nr:putative transporter [Colletotrichum sp. SAR 10_65]KAJ5004765.1 putative transporter [Colletotrichum sp. SAR 10_66]